MMKTITMPVKGLNFAGCAREIEKRLGKLEAIKSVEASCVSQIATIPYDPAQLSEEHLPAMVKDRGFACGEPLLATRSAIIAEPGRSEDHMPLSPMSSALSMWERSP
jgi:copper chaperone CopZ